MKNLLLAATTLAHLAPALPAAPLDFTFLPPAVEEQDLCGPSAPTAQTPTGAGSGASKLSDKDRVRFLARDIRRYQTDDPDRWFRFIDTLISRRATLDPSFDGVDEKLARISLYVDAGRLTDLQKTGLVSTLAEDREALNNAQRVRLAQYLLNGIGTARDPELGHALIREAGFAGNADALLLLARRMVEGNAVPDWETPAELTVAMAFGGLLGQMDSGVCSRALRIAEAYQQGEIVHRNEDVALAWIRFAADLGSPNAAWRMVEHQLSADVATKDVDEMLRYLSRAVDRGIVAGPRVRARLAASDQMDVAELGRQLGYNFSETYGRRRPSLAKYLTITAKPYSEITSADAPYMAYLREIIEIPSAPGAVFTELAKETMLRHGRWKGEAEALVHLEQSARLKDPEGTRLLAERLLRYRHDVERTNRAVDLLSYAGNQLGDAASLKALDRFYRCQIPTAPQLNQARHWAAAYRATANASLSLSADDLITLDPIRDPWSFAILQSQALEARPRALASFLQLVQADPLATQVKQQLWADRADNSDKTLEEFAKLEYDLAGTPAERDLALELFRRVYLNNRVTPALDLSIAFIDHLGRDPAIAKDVRTMLRHAANRGEGAALRLLMRLEKDPDAEVKLYKEFAGALEARGDFLGMMVALPHVAPEKRADYLDRAVSLMSCSTKDVAEVTDIETLFGNHAESVHWQQVSLALERGNVLSKLRLRDRQYDVFDTIIAPTAADLANRVTSEVTGVHQAKRLYHLFANPELDTYAPKRAAEAFAKVLDSGEHTEIIWTLEQYHLASQPLRAAIRTHVEITTMISAAADAGDPTALELHAFLLLDQAESRDDLVRAAQVMARAAERGRSRAMAEWGRMLALGLGTDRNIMEAVQWLDKAVRAGHRDAKDTLRLLRLSEDG